MTNEQLAALIKHGGADELTPILWGRVRKLIYMLCDKYYAAYSNRFAACGVERDDLKQESYFAFLKAISSFNESSGLLFTSYLEYPVKNAGAELLGIRNAMRCNRKPLDNCKSLNESLPSSDGDELCYLDTVTDETAEQAFERALKRVSDEETRAALNKALNKLSERERGVVVKEYFDGLVLREIAASYGLSIERVRQIKLKALKRLRVDPELKLYRKGQCLERCLHYGSRKYTSAYFAAQEKIKNILKYGDYFSPEQRQRIIQSCTESMPT